ncbi:MAG: cell division protein FtsQ/DivIB [Anaerolineae bacterium]
MKRKQKGRRYYRTAALLGPQDRRAAYRAASQPFKLRIPWKVVVPLLAVVGLGLWVAFGNFWYLMWDDLTVTGVTSPELQYQIKLDTDLLGWHLIDLRPKSAEEALIAKYPQFADVKVSCIPVPTSCKVAVVERSPVLAWQDGSALHWVDLDGVLYPAQGERPDLPVIRGPVPGEGGAHSVTAVREGITALAALGVPIEQLEYTHERGLVWTDPQNVRIAFGVGDAMSERWGIYQSLINQLAAKGVSPQTMDVRFPEAVTYSLERSW